MGWKTIERPGYFGKKREELAEKWNEEYGKGNWRLAYEWGKLVIPREEALQIYEDGYYEWFKKYPAKLEWLISKACDVYDTAPSNVHSGFDYSKQETPNTHLQDIAIRRSIMRLGRGFDGYKLIEIRGKDSEGADYSPSIVPFHLRSMIYHGKIMDYGGKGHWWDPYTIEDFYQKNKLLQIK
ncbi:MAG: hypothetical protein KKA79_07700 [Nanoarchaeota archaeon]|nr:hypothetical protein [Nanoarchaeota archaeon]MCG2718798.1 hypothetical protein [Nanoarchaeota archaeon]